MAATSTTSPGVGVPALSLPQGFEYYTSKVELLDWVNRLLDLKLTRLEQARQTGRARSVCI